MNQKTFLFIGRSGCGKGTQAKLLEKVVAEKTGGEKVFYLQTGDQFRNFIQGDGYTNKISAGIYKAGELQPAFLANHMWTTLLIKEFEGQHLILDGAARTMPEGLTLTSALQFYNIEKPTVIHMNVSDEWSTARLLGRGRFDDNTEEVKRRLAWFTRDVLPVIEYFKTNSYYNFVEVNGEQSIEDVHKEIVQKLSL